MIAKYIIDVNLPYHFSLWNSSDFIHVRDINDEWSDSEIWKYAKENNLTIITKDNDFSARIIFHQPPPKVIHICFGNLKMRQFYEQISTCWLDVSTISNNSKLVKVFLDRLEAIQ